MSESSITIQNSPAKGPPFSDLLKESWQSLKQQLGLGIGITILFLAAGILLNRLPLIGILLGFLLNPGYILFLNAIRTNDNPNANHLLWLFSDFNRILQFLALSVLTMVIVSLGLVLLLIPGIYLFITLTFSQIIFLLEKPDAISSMKQSMALVKNRWWYIHNIYLWLFLLNLGGFLALGVGLLVTIPLTHIIHLNLYSRIKANQTTNSEVPV